MPPPTTTISVPPTLPTTTTPTVKTIP
jgi:hypothetical protein